MSIRRQPLARALLRRSAAIFDASLAWLMLAVVRAIRLTDRRRAADFAGWFMRKLGPWLPEHRIGRANLTAAFPEKPPAEIEQILAGVWDNLGRVVAEFAHLDRLLIGDPFHLPHFEFEPAMAERYNRIRDDGKPALIFAAHLANWELPAIVAHAWGIEALTLYRRPNVGAVADAVIAIRQGSMGTLVPTESNAPIRLARALEENRHVGMLVDQHYVKGVDVSFFGRRCRANPLLATLARHVECPIHGVRIIRLPGGRFRGEISEAVAPVRDAAGRIDVAGTTQAITTVIEGWVREHPEQWLWLHRRWRD